MKKLKVRPLAENDEPPPIYKSVELLITIRLHYGGMYVNAPCPTHSRDSVSVIDNVGISYISLEGIRRLCDVVGLEGVMGLYLKDECGGFVLILCNKELKTCFLNTMMNPDMQEMSIYVDCVGVASRVEMEGHNIGLDDDVADGLCGNDEGGGEEGYESSDCDNFVDSEYEMESDTDFGINVIGGDDGLTDVNLDDGVDDLGNNLQNVNGNVEEGGNVVVTDGSSELGRGDDVSNSGSDNVVESGDGFLSVKGSDSESEGSSFPVLNIEKFEDWTFMSDKQKGLIQAFHAVFPGADHRFCVRHMHSNFKRAGFTGEALKECLWKAARASTVNEWLFRMKVMAALNESAMKWFDDKPPQQWSKSHFNAHPKCDILLNNGCEAFNACILDARDMPIVSMLEWIMEYVMTRLRINRDRAQRYWKGLICPKIKGFLEKEKDYLGECDPIKSNDEHYQVGYSDSRQFSVNLRLKTCGCRKWDISGIPCIHGLSAITAQGLNEEEMVNSYYSVETYRQVYEPAIMPINGRMEWKKSDFIPPLPPHAGRGVGRPQSARRMEADERISKKQRKCRGKKVAVSANNPKKMKRQQRTCKCKYCGGLGHNTKGCQVRKNAEHNVVLVEPNETEVDLSSQFPTANSQVSSIETSNSARGNEHRTPHQSTASKYASSMSSGNARPTPNQSIVPNTRNTVSGKGKANLTAPSRTQSMQPIATPASYPVSTLIPGPSVETQLEQVHRKTKKTQIINIAGGTFRCTSSQAPKLKKSKK